MARTIALLGVEGRRVTCNHGETFESEVFKHHLTVAVWDNVWNLRLNRHSKVLLAHKLKQVLLLVRLQLAKEPRPDLALNVRVMQKSTSLRMADSLSTTVVASRSCLIVSLITDWNNVARAVLDEAVELSHRLKGLFWAKSGFQLVCAIIEANGWHIEERLMKFALCWGFGVLGWHKKSTFKNWRTKWKWMFTITIRVLSHKKSISN